MNNYTVYKHTAPNGKVYIGITCQDVNRRWQNGHGYKENEIFYRAINKYGWDNFKHEIIAEGLTEHEAYELEIILIAEHKATDRAYGYNRHPGGEVHDTICMYDLLKGDYLPYETIRNDPVLNEIFEGLINSALGHEYKETVTRIYYEDGQKVKTEKEETFNKVKPSHFAICLLTDHYGDTERIKPLMPILCKMRSEIDLDLGGN